MVAYAKTSGVNRLLPYMRQFKENGGTIKAVVGIDQGNTSYEALISLLSVCNELYIYLGRFHADIPGESIPFREI